MLQERLSLLFITTELPYPADSGGRIKTFRLLEFLSKHYDVLLLCAHGGDRVKDMQALRAAVSLKGLQAFSSFKKRSAINWVNALMSFPTFNAFRIHSREMEAMIQWSATAADIVLMDHLEIVNMLPERFYGKLIYHSHNAEFKLWEELADLEANPLKKWAISLEASRVKKLETYAIRKSVFTFAAPNDSELICDTIGFKPEAFRLTYHLGNDGLLALPEMDLAANPKRLFYAGTLSWEPNRDGLSWFLLYCWLAIRQQEPESELVICGRGADDDLVHIAHQMPGVEYKGFVKDLDEEMRQCRAAVVPLRFGSGMKIKTFDALYRGLPLVTTPTGAEGIALEHNTHALIGDSVGEMVQHVVTLLQDPQKGQSMARNGRALVKKKYTYATLFEGMLADLKSIP